MNNRSHSPIVRILAVVVGTIALGQPALANGKDPVSRIQGVWNVRVNITNCLPGNVPGPIVFLSFDAINLFGADGTFLDANSQNPAAQSPHLGYWRHIRGTRYEFAEKFFLFDEAGATTGWRIVRHRVELARGGLSFSSGGTAETFNTEGVQIGTGCSTSTAVRFD
jgi:hypothetical protein